MKILIVEDDTDSGEALMHLLLDFGHEVLLVMNPVQAPAASLGFRPHVAILDIGLPMISGYELIAQLRALPALGTCSYLSVSADADHEVALQSERAGFARHLSKPLNVSHLLEELALLAPPELS